MDLRAKEYLSQIRKLDVLINQRIQEKESLRNSLMLLSAVDVSRERVQGGRHSPDNRVINTLCKINRMEREIDALIDELVDKKHAAINKIQRIDSSKQAYLLHEHYITGKRLDEIAQKLHYSYGYVRQLHQQALREFEKTNTI
nr:MAG TPA: Protein of unknown function (DUF1492) [Caudoviricetes sp.]